MDKKGGSKWRWMGVDGSRWGGWGWIGGVGVDGGDGSRWGGWGWMGVDKRGGS